MASGSRQSSSSGRSHRDIDMRVHDRDIDMRAERDVDMRPSDIDERSGNIESTKNKRSTAAQFFNQTEESSSASTQEMVITKKTN